MKSVNPRYQGQGMGSMLLRWGCDMADTDGQDTFLIASPAGILLYLKFGFNTVREIWTKGGIFTSMFRKAQPQSKHNNCLA
jgi:predicted N-acetyltransferase YhbS